MYNLENDPYELHNLAGEAPLASKLKELRAALKGQMIGENDLGLFPEPLWLPEGGNSPVAFGNKNKQRLKRFSDIADLELRTFKEAR